MKLRLLFAAIIIYSMSACAPRVLCPAYAVDDSTVPQANTKAQKDM